MRQLKIGVVGVRDGWSSEQLADEFASRTDFYCLLEMKRIKFDVTSGQVRYGDLNLSTLDALVVKKIGARYSPDLLERLVILRYLERSGLRIFSRPDSIARALDRLSGTAVLRMGDIPMPPTVITEDLREAAAAVQQFGTAVLKPIYSTKARGMQLVKSGNGVSDQLKSFRQAGNKVLYIQKLIPLPGRDLGLVFIGGEYLATYARVKNGDSWNTTIRDGGCYEPHEPSHEALEIARRAQALFDLDFTSVDVAETPDGAVVFEVSAFGGFRGLKEAHGINAAEHYADYVIDELTK
jgi:ribosomal protein S6--L-glutamate ligase